jgi:hypothetical protein
MNLFSSKMKILSSDGNGIEKYRRVLQRLCRLFTIRIRATYYSVGLPETGRSFLSSSLSNVDINEKVSLPFKLN